MTRRFALTGLLLSLVACSRSESSSTSTTTAGSAPGTDNKTNVTVKGSDTMVILGQRWAEHYMKLNSRHDHPGHRRRLGHRHRRAHQRLDRHLRVEPPDEGQGEGRGPEEARRSRRRDEGRARRACRVREREEPAPGDLDPDASQDLPGRDEELEGGGRTGSPNRALRPREQLRHLRVLQGARPRRTRTSRLPPRRSPAPPRSRTPSRATSSASATAASPTSKAYAPSR